MYKLLTPLALALAPTTAALAGPPPGQDEYRVRGPATRSDQAMPRAHNDNGRRDERGPPHGFPNSPGLEHARHHADCHAAFRHCDSPGG